MKKLDLTLIPPIANLDMGKALFNGAIIKGYGPFNWRKSAIKARVYVAAARRHLDRWEVGEEFAQDSGIHHMGHLMACAAIIRDAQIHDTLIDDRFHSPVTIAAMDAADEYVLNQIEMQKATAGA